MFYCPHVLLPYILLFILCVVRSVPYGFYYPFFILFIAITFPCVHRLVIVVFCDCFHMIQCFVTVRYCLQCSKDIILQMLSILLLKCSQYFPPNCKMYLTICHAMAYQLSDIFIQIWLFLWESWKLWNEAEYQYLLQRLQHLKWMNLKCNFWMLCTQHPDYLLSGT